MDRLFPSVRQIELAYEMNPYLPPLPPGHISPEFYYENHTACGVDFMPIMGLDAKSANLYLHLTNHCFKRAARFFKHFDTFHHLSGVDRWLRLKPKIVYEVNVYADNIYKQATPQLIEQTLAVFDVPIKTERKLSKLLDSIVSAAPQYSIYHYLPSGPAGSDLLIEMILIRIKLFLKVNNVLFNYCNQCFTLYFLEHQDVELLSAQLSDFACALGLQLNVCEKNSYNQPVALYNNPEFEVCLPTRWFNHEDMYGYLQRWYAQVRGTLIEPLPYYLLDRHVEYLVRLSLSVLRSDAEGFPAVARWLMWLGSQSVHKIRALISAEARHILEFDGFKVTSSSVNRAWLVTLMHLDLTPDGLDYLRSLLPDEESALVRLLIEG